MYVLVDRLGRGHAMDAIAVVEAFFVVGTAHDPSIIGSMNHCDSLCLCWAFLLGPLEIDNYELIVL
jgi:hypothetical protein